MASCPMNAEVAIDHQLSQDEKDKCFQVCQRRFAEKLDGSNQRIDRELALRRFKSNVNDPLLRRIFKGIQKQYQEVVLDAIVNELSHDEIAKKHGWSSPEVSRQKLHQALAAIAKLPLPVVTVEIDEEGRMKAFNWD